MNNNYSVYKHTFPNGKVYIGITKQKPERRWQQRGRGYVYQNKDMFLDIQRAGWDNIKHEILFEGLTQEEAYAKEIELVSFYDSTNKEKGYNISPGGRKLSQEHKEILRQTMIGNKYRLGLSQSQEAKEKIKQYQTGRKHPHSQEIKEKIKRGLLKRGKIDRKVSEAGKANISKANSKQIYQQDVEGGIIKVWESIIVAAISLNISHDSISHVLCGRNKTAGGYVWKYVEDVNKQEN